MADDSAPVVPSIPSGESVVSDALSVVALLKATNGSRLSKAIAVMTAAQTSYRVGKKAWSWVDARTRDESYTVSVAENDPIYERLQIEIIQILENDGRVPSAQRAVTRYQDDGMVMNTVNADQSTMTINLEGHKIVVGTTRDNQKYPGGNNTSSDPDGYVYTTMTPLSLVFYSESREGREAVIRFIRSVVMGETRRRRHIFTASTGWWTGRSFDGTRDPKTLVLREGQLDEILADVKKFRESRDDYRDWGMPWHRGYLFYGPPGTGKTSLATVIASEFSLNVYFLSISSMKNDAELIKMVRDVEKDSVLVLEDTDILRAARSREAESDDENVTLAGLLNALDGITTPEGLIVIMTSNNKDVIDPALIRPGRMDMIQHIGHVDEYQVRTMAKVFLGIDVSVTVERDTSPAEVLELLRQHRDEPSLIEAELDNLLSLNRIHL